MATSQEGLNYMDLINVTVDFLAVTCSIERTRVNRKMLLGFKVTK
jgi:hypothetical protein